MRIVPLICLMATLPWLLVAQERPDSQVAPLVIDQPEDIPAEYQEAVLDLVERYEEVRRLLREEMERSADLYTQEELDAAVAEVEARVTEAREDTQQAREQYKALRVAYKNAAEEALGFKAALAKTQFALSDEIDTLERVIDGTEEENILQIGTTFSPAGSLGAFGILNLPGTNVGLLGGATYRLREQELNAMFGVSFSFLSQSSVVEGWERLRNRFGNRAADKAFVTEEASAEELDDIKGATSTSTADVGEP